MAWEQGYSMVVGVAWERGYSMVVGVAWERGYSMVVGVAWEQGYSTKTDGGNGMGMRLLTDGLASYCQYMTQSILPKPKPMTSLVCMYCSDYRELHCLHSGNAFAKYLFNEPITVK